MNFINLELEGIGTPSLDKNKIDQEANLVRGSIVGGINFLRNTMITIVAIASIIVIFNSFQVSIVERKKQFGILKSLGATKWQIYFAVLFEALLYTIFGLLIGIVLGFLGAYIIQQILMNIINGSLIGVGQASLNFEFIITYKDILIIMISTAITIFVSAFVPAILAGRISPIEAIRKKDSVNLKAKKVKTFKLFKNMFGVEFDLGIKNVKRSKSKFRVALISLTVVFILFYAISNIKLITMKHINEIKHDIVKNGLVDSVKVDYSILLDKFIKIEEVKELNKKIDKKVGISSNFNDYLIRNFSIELNENKSFILSNKYKKDLKYNKQDANTANVNIIMINKKYEPEMLKKLGIEKFSDNTAILFNKYKTYENSIKIEKNIVDSINGKGIKLKKSYIVKSNKNNEEGYEVEKNINIDNIILVDKIPTIPLNQIKNIDISILVNEKTFENLYKELLNNKEKLSNEVTIDSVNVYKSKDVSVRNTIIQNINHSDFKEINKDGVKIYIFGANDVSKIANMFENFMFLVQLLLFGFLGLIILIDTTNIFSTIAINVLTRQQEIAILESNGMTKKQINKMVRTENLIVCLKAVIFGILISIAVIYFVFYKVENRLLFPMKFLNKLDYISLVIAIFMIYLISFVSSKYAIRKINKQHIVEVINNDNI